MKELNFKNQVAGALKFLSTLCLLAMVFVLVPMLAHAGPVADIADQIGTGLIKYIVMIVMGVFLIYRIGFFLLSLVGITDQSSSFGPIAMQTVIAVVVALLWTPAWEGISGFLGSIGI